MAGFIEGIDRGQLSLLPESLDQWVDDCNPVRVIDAFVEALDLDDLGFKMAEPADIGRPGYSPALHLKLYIYGYLNRIHSSRRKRTKINPLPWQLLKLQQWLRFRTASSGSPAV